MDNTEHDDLDLVLSFDKDVLYQSMLHNREPDRFVSHYSGCLKILADEDDPGDVDDCTVAGTVEVIVVDAVSAVIERESLFDVFGCDSKTLEFYEALYDRGEDNFSDKAVRAACGDEAMWNPNLLLLDRLVVYPEFRGKGLGLEALKILIHRFRMGVGLIAMKPFPLQYEGRYPARQGDADNNRIVSREFGDFTASQDKATKKLKKYYSRLGFKPVPRTPYMVRSPEVRLSENED